MLSYFPYRFGLIILVGIVVLFITLFIIGYVQISQNPSQTQSEDKNMTEKLKTIVYHSISNKSITLLEINSDGSWRKTTEDEEKNLPRLERKIYIGNFDKEKTEKLFSQVQDVLKLKNPAGEKILITNSVPQGKTSIVLYGFGEENIYLTHKKQEYRKILPGNGDNWRELIGEFANPGFEEIIKIIQNTNIEFSTKPAKQIIERNEKTIAGEGAAWGFILEDGGVLHLYGSGNTGAGLIVSTEVISQIDKNKVDNIFKDVEEIVKKESLDSKQDEESRFGGAAFLLTGFSNFIISVYENRSGFTELSELTEEFSKQVANISNIENESPFFVDRLFFEYTPAEENKEGFYGAIDITGFLAIIPKEKNYYGVNNLNAFMSSSPEIIQGKRDISTIFDLRTLADTIPGNNMKELNQKTVQEFFTKIQQVVDKTPKPNYGENPQPDYSEKEVNYVIAYSFPTISWPEAVVVGGRRIFLGTEARQLIEDILGKQKLVPD